jgi:hypothetical protein
VYKGLDLKICRAKRYIENYLANGGKELPIQIHTGEYSTSSYTEWEGMEYVNGDTDSTTDMTSYDSNWRDNNEGYKSLTNDFRVEFTNDSVNTDQASGYYMGKDSDFIAKDGYPEIEYSCNAVDTGINLFNLNLQHYSKYYTISSYVNRDATGLSPLIKTVDDLDKYNIAVNEYRQPYIKTHVSV